MQQALPRDERRRDTWGEEYPAAAAPPESMPAAPGGSLLDPFNPAGPEPKAPPGPPLDPFAPQLASSFDPPVRRILTMMERVEYDPASPLMRQATHFGYQNSDSSGTDIEAELEDLNQRLFEAQQALLSAPRRDRRGLRDKVEALDASIKRTREELAHPAADSSQAAFRPIKEGEEEEEEAGGLGRDGGSGRDPVSFSVTISGGIPTKSLSPPPPPPRGTSRRMEALRAEDTHHHHPNHGASPPRAPRSREEEGREAMELPAMSPREETRALAAAMAVLGEPLPYDAQGLKAVKGRLAEAEASNQRGEEEDLSPGGGAMEAPHRGAWDVTAGAWDVTQSVSRAHQTPTLKGRERQGSAGRLGALLSPQEERRALAAACLVLGEPLLEGGDTVGRERLWARLEAERRRQEAESLASSEEGEEGGEGGEGGPRCSPLNPRDPSPWRDLCNTRTEEDAPSSREGSPLPGGCSSFQVSPTDTERSAPKLDETGTSLPLHEHFSDDSLGSRLSAAPAGLAKEDEEEREEVPAGADTDREEGSLIEEAIAGGADTDREEGSLIEEAIAGGADTDREEGSFVAEGETDTETETQSQRFQDASEGSFEDASEGSQLDVEQEGKGQDWEGSAREIFVSVDKDHNDLLSHRELKSYLQSNAWAVPYIDSDAFHWAELWERYDHNRDGYIDINEFLTLYSIELRPLMELAEAVDGFTAALDAPDLCPEEEAEDEAESVTSSGWFSSVPGAGLIKRGGGAIFGAVWNAIKAPPGKKAIKAALMPKYGTGVGLVAVQTLQGAVIGKLERRNIASIERDETKQAAVVLAASIQGKESRKKASIMAQEDASLAGATIATGIQGFASRRGTKLQRQRIIAASERVQANIRGMNARRSTGEALAVDEEWNEAWERLQKEESHDQTLSPEGQVLPLGEGNAEGKEESSKLQAWVGGVKLNADYEMTKVEPAAATPELPKEEQSASPQQDDDNKLLAWMGGSPRSHSPSTRKSPLEKKLKPSHQTRMESSPTRPPRDAAVDAVDEAARKEGQWKQDSAKPNSASFEDFLHASSKVLDPQSSEASPSSADPSSAEPSLGPRTMGQRFFEMERQRRLGVRASTSLRLQDFASPTDETPEALGKSEEALGKSEEAPACSEGLAPALPELDVTSEDVPEPREKGEDELESREEGVGHEEEEVPPMELVDGSDSDEGEQEGVESRIEPKYAVWHGLVRQAFATASNGANTLPVSSLVDVDQCHHGGRCGLLELMSVEGEVVLADLLCAIEELWETIFPRILDGSGRPLLHHHLNEIASAIQPEEGQEMASAWLRSRPSAHASSYGTAEGNSSTSPSRMGVLSVPAEEQEVTRFVVMACLFPYAHIQGQDLAPEDEAWNAALEAMSYSRLQSTWSSSKQALGGLRRLLTIEAKQIPVCKFKDGWEGGLQEGDDPEEQESGSPGPSLESSSPTSPSTPDRLALLASRFGVQKEQRESEKEASLPRFRRLDAASGVKEPPRVTSSYLHQDGSSSEEGDTEEDDDGGGGEDDVEREESSDDREAVPLVSLDLSSPMHKLEQTPEGPQLDLLSRLAAKLTTPDPQLARRPPPNESGHNQARSARAKQRLNRSAVGPPRSNSLSRSVGEVASSSLVTSPWAKNRGGPRRSLTPRLPVATTGPSPKVQGMLQEMRQAKQRKTTPRGAREATPVVPRPSPTPMWLKSATKARAPRYASRAGLFDPNGA